MKCEEACYALKLECALRDLGFVDIGWKTVAHAGIFFVQPVGIPDEPEGGSSGIFCINTIQKRLQQKVSFVRNC